MMLKYRSHAMIHELALGECTVHPASNSSSVRWWQLWFYVLRDSDGQPETFCVPVNPGGSYSENGPGGRTWGLTIPDASMYESPPSTRTWQVTPSVNVLDDRDAVAGTRQYPSLWHQTPAIVGVPLDERWTTGAPP